jgi:acetone carboxylase gamma subunit
VVCLWREEERDEIPQLVSSDPNTHGAVEFSCPLCANLLNLMQTIVMLQT